MAKKKSKPAVEDRTALETSQTAEIAWYASEFQDHPVIGLTPQRLHQLLTSAESGNLTAQADLFADMTNTPSLDVLPDVLLAAASQVFYVQQPEESTVDEEQLAALGLPKDATKEQVMAKIAELNTAALSQQNPAEPDPAKYVPIGMYSAAQAKIVDLTCEVKSKEADDLITAALSDGRLLGEDAEKWARDFAGRDFDGFKKHIEATPKIAALSQQQSRQSQQQQQPAPAGQLDDVTVAIAAQMGVDAADVSKFGAQA